MTLLTEMTPGMWVVIIQLRNQVELVRINYPLWGGQLRYFRKAFRMRRFHEVVERVEQILGFGIFSTMQEIESMESAILNCDRTQLIVQCCAILHFCERVNYRDERFSNHEREHSWLFASIRSLEEIAYLRSRLHFVMAASYVWAAMNHSLVRAVNECFLDVWNPPTWQGLLLILKESGPFYSDRFLEHLAEILPNQRTEIPKEAATLFLSYTADAILYLRATFGNRVDADEKKLIVKLLELGASPMISREHHCVFFGRLENHVRTVRSPWWTAWEHLTSSSMKRFPTALNRLLSDSWDPEFSRQLEQYTCCSLDAADTHKKNYRSGRVPKLQCLAAQNLRESDLEALPPTLKFIAAKHQPFSFIQYFRRN